jgi:hypothetical protein
LGATALLSLDVNSDLLFEQFEPGFFAKGNFDAFVAAAERLLTSRDELSKAQMGSERFVAELHDNARNVDLFLDGLRA